MKNIEIYGIISLMLILLFLRNGLSAGVSPSLILLISIIPALFATPSQMVAMGAAFIPMATGFQIKYALLLYIIIGIIRFHKALCPSKVLVPIFLMMIWELIHGVFSSFPFTLNEYMRSFAELLFLGFITTLQWDKIDFRIIARSISIAVIGVSAIIIYIQINSGLGNLMEMLSQDAMEYRFGQDTLEDTQYGLNFNANGLGFICNFAIICLLTIIARKEYNILDVIMVVACVFIGFITLSRTFVAVLSLLFVAFLFLAPKSTQKQSFGLLPIAIIIVGVGLILSYAPVIMENFMGRMEEDDISNGRTALFAFYNSHIFSSFEYLIYGIGAQNYGRKIYELYGPGWLVSHNGIQELIVTWGIVGLILFTWMIYSMYKVSRQWSGYYRIVFASIPLLCMLMSAMAGQLITNGTRLMALPAIFVALCLKWPNKDILR